MAGCSSSLFHLFVVTNIDNVLRPFLVPQEARLDPALMLLAVFAGIAMFGFWGIVIGPVLMIIIVTTISVYLAVYKGVPLDEHADDDKPKRQGRLALAAANRRPDANSPTAEPDASRQPLLEELDDALARLVGRMPVDLADLKRSAPSAPSARSRARCPSSNRSR